ncbi:MAG TPA: hypothetical protein VIU29_09340 [Candidatus Deferrimicrobiaceae bacterium]
MERVTSANDPIRQKLPSSSDRAFLWGAVLAFAGAALACGQALYLAVEGKELCVGGGCALVGKLTRIPPEIFNLFGAGVFAAAGILALASRKTGSQTVRFLLCALLTAAWSAEGVLFAYQMHVASAWCSYCLVILAVVAALNVLLCGRAALLGAGAFAASAVIFSLLSFTPFNKTLADGTYAVRPGSGGPVLTLLFSENCPHCKEVEEVIAELGRCTVRYNPVDPITRDILPGLDRFPAYDTRVNSGAAALLGFNQIPLLIVEEESGLRVIEGAGSIIGYLRTACGAPAPVQSDNDPGMSVMPGDEGCAIEEECQ